MREDTRTIVFALVTCLVCSFLLALIYAVLKPNQDRNENEFRVRNVLLAFGFEAEEGEELSSELAMSTFSNRITEVFIDDEGNEVENVVKSSPEFKAKTASGELMQLYKWTEEGQAPRYGFPASGYGLWGTIYSYVALQSDLATIEGVTFYKHKETPGLGAECSKPWFQNQFKGKKLFDNGGLTEFKVVKGKTPKELEDDPYAVGGIAAATITANGIQKFINADMARYEKYFSKIRKG